jgi:hypothetical protein
MFPSQSTSSNGATAVARVSDGLQRTKMPQRQTATSQRRQRSIQTSSLERHAPSAVRTRGPTSPYFFLSQSTAPLSQLAFSPIVIVAQGSPVAVIVAIVGIPPIFNSSGYTRLQYISNLPISRSSTCQRNLPRIGIYNITGQGRPRQRVIGPTRLVLLLVAHRRHYQVWPTYQTSLKRFSDIPNHRILLKATCHTRDSSHYGESTNTKVR